MNKREFLGNTIKLATAATVGSLAMPTAWAQGRGYQLVDPPQNTRNPDKIEVLEYFWFGCPHCFAFEPAINKWAAERPDDVDFVRSAPPLNPGWTAHSEAFYAAESLGVTDKMFDQLFDGIHVERRPLRDANSISAFVSDLGIDEDKFRDTMKSFAVATKMKQASSMARATGITGVPSVVVNGKYLTSVSMAGGHQQIIQVIDDLIDRERQGA